MQQGASTQELLPCPFDGRADYLNIGSDHIDGDTRFQAWCNYCGMTGPHEATEAEAITAWNTRRDERVDALVSALASEREDNLWNAFNTGCVKDGRWTHMFMSDGEWLARECGLDPKLPDYDAEEIKAAIPQIAQAFAARAALQLIGKE